MYVWYMGSSASPQTVVGLPKLPGTYKRQLVPLLQSMPVAVSECRGSLPWGAACRQGKGAVLAVAGVGAVGPALQGDALSQGQPELSDQTFHRGISHCCKAVLDQGADRRAFCNIKQSKGSLLSFMCKWFSPDWFRAGEKRVHGMQSSTGCGAVGEAIHGSFWSESAWLVGALLLEVETCSQVQYISHFC